MPGVTTASALTSSIHYQPFRYPPPSPPSNCSEEIDDLASSYLAITEFLLKESSDSGESHSKNNTCSQQQPPIKKPVCCNKQDQATRDDLDGKVAMSTTKCSNERDASMAAADSYLRPIIAPREKVAAGYQVNNEQLQQRPMSWPPATSTPSLSSSMHFNGDRKSTAVDIRMSPRSSLSATTTTRAVASILDGIARDETFDRHLTGTSSGGGGDQLLPSICIIRNEHDALLHYSSSNIKNQSRMSDDAMDPLYGILQSIYHAEKQMIRRMEARQSSSSSSSNETCSPPRDRRGLRRSLSNLVLTCKGNEKNKKNSWWFKSMIRGRFAQDKQSSDEYPPRFSLSRRLLATLPGTKTTRLATLVSRSKSDLQQQPSLSVHMQQSVYRMSHLKLANPQRPLLQQVMISNFMHWCLAVQPW